MFVKNVVLRPRAYVVLRPCGMFLKIRHFGASLKPKKPKDLKSPEKWLRNLHFKQFVQGCQRKNVQTYREFL